MKPGQKESITFIINAGDLASFDTKSASWLAEAGTYSVKIGASSADIKQSADFRLKKNLIVERNHNVLVHQVPIPDFTR